jgi:hypothetical protein
MTTTETVNLYPLVTKAQIADKMFNSFEYRCEVMCLLHTLQTEYEQATRTTLNRNRQGFMSSHAVVGSRTAEKLKAGETLEDDDVIAINKIAPRYSRQVAVYERAKQLANNPELRAIAAKFGVQADDSEEG